MSDVHDKAHVTNVHAARQSCESLKAFAAAIHKKELAYLQQQSCAITDEALQVLDQLPKNVQALHPECNFPKEADTLVADAALMVQDCVLILQGKLAIACRQQSASWGKLDLLLQHRQHKKIFKEARDGLARSRKLLANALLDNVATTNSSEGQDFHQQPAQQQQQQQQLAVTYAPGSMLGSINRSSSSSSSSSLSIHHDTHRCVLDSNSELVLKEVIGSDAHGKVYRGTMRAGTIIDIAAKEYLTADDIHLMAHNLNAHQPNRALCDTSKPWCCWPQQSRLEAGNCQQPSEAAIQRAREELQRKAALLSTIKHSNIVRFCGVALDPPLLVMEYYRHGSVHSILDKARQQWGNNLSAKLQLSNDTDQHCQFQYGSCYRTNYPTWGRCLEMLHDVAVGMAYLHECRYLHGNLHSANLFVGMDNRVKIGDFDFTRRLAENEASMPAKHITHRRCMAPELLTQKRASVASDVYSYGVIMYEMLTWQVPFLHLTEDEAVLQVVSGGRPKIPWVEELPPVGGSSSRTCLGSYIKLMQQCWDQDAERRPSFKQIAAHIKAMMRWHKAISSSRLDSHRVLAVQGAK